MTVTIFIGISHHKHSTVCYFYICHLVLSVHATLIGGKDFCYEFILNIRGYMAMSSTLKNNMMVNHAQVY